MSWQPSAQIVEQRLAFMPIPVPIWLQIGAISQMRMGGCPHTLDVGWPRYTAGTFSDVYASAQFPILSSQT